MKLSRYLRISSREGQVAAFHELHPDPIYFRQAEWESLTNPTTAWTEATTQKLRERGLLVQSEADDDRDFLRTSAQLEKKLDEPLILYLMMAQGCNFACRYCPIPQLAREYGETLLLVEDAIAGIELWIRHLKEAASQSESHVIFYGGEPLLNKAAIPPILRHISEGRNRAALPLSGLHLVLCTNGVLIDDEVIGWCREFDVTVAVGLDGSAPTNDNLRIHSDGRGSYDDIATQLRRLTDNGIRTSASVTITPFNLQEIPDFSPMLKRLGVEKFGFNLLRGEHLDQLVPPDARETYYRQAARAIIENSKRHGFGPEYQAVKRRRAFETRDFFPLDCTCYGNQLVIQPDGQISHCPFSRTRLGPVRQAPPDFRIQKSSTVHEWRRHLPLYAEGCHPCVATGLSGGGCVWGILENGAVPGAIDDGARILAEEILEELIWMKFEEEIRDR